MTEPSTFTAFVDGRVVGSGSLGQVAAALSALEGRGVIFGDATGHIVELDLRHGPEHAVSDYLSREAPPDAPPRRGRGRPRLGVVAREVTLLPRHWDWLAGQPGGASAALRRLVEEARRAGPDRARQARDAAYRVMTELGGNLSGYEEATRALFAGDLARLETFMATWPPDIAAYVRRIAGAR